MKTYSLLNERRLTHVYNKVNVVFYKIQGPWFILRKSVGPWGKVHGSILRSENPAHGVGFPDLEWKEQMGRWMAYVGAREQIWQSTSILSITWKEPICFLLMTSLKACVPKFTSCNTSVYENSCEPKDFYEFCGKLNHDYLEVEAGLPRPGPGQPYSFALSGSPVFYSCSLDFRLWSTTYFHLTLHVHSAWSLEHSFYLINACGLHDCKNNSQHLLLSSVKTQR